jgi:cytochrome b561
LPLTGWLNASTRSWEPILLSVIPMPRLVPSDNALGHGVDEYHSLLSWVLLVLIGVHVLGALYHQFILKDNLIERMWNRKR